MNLRGGELPGELLGQAGRERVLSAAWVLFSLVSIVFILTIMQVTPHGIIWMFITAEDLSL